MTWQLGAVALLVAVAGLYLVHSAWRTLRGKKTGCGGGCRCDTKAGDTDGRVTIVPVDQLMLRPTFNGATEEFRGEPSASSDPQSR